MISMSIHYYLTTPTCSPSDYLICHHHDHRTATVVVTITIWWYYSSSIVSICVNVLVLIYAWWLERCLLSMAAMCLYFGQLGVHGGHLLHHLVVVVGELGDTWPVFCADWDHISCCARVGLHFVGWLLCRGKLTLHGRLNLVLALIW